MEMNLQVRKHIIKALTIFAGLTMMLLPLNTWADESDQAAVIIEEVSSIKDSETTVESSVTEKKQVTEEVTIEDEDTPLATMKEQQPMNWWWLLGVLVLGATGAELYIRYREKNNIGKRDNIDKKNK